MEVETNRFRQKINGGMWCPKLERVLADEQWRGFLGDLFDPVVMVVSGGSTKLCWRLQVRVALDKRRSNRA